MKGVGGADLALRCVPFYALCRPNRARFTPLVLWKQSPFYDANGTAPS